MVATRDFLDWYPTSRTHDCGTLDLGQTCLFLFTFDVGCVLLELLSLIVSRTGFILVERDVVNSADAKATSRTSEDIGFD